MSSYHLLLYSIFMYYIVLHLQVIPGHEFCGVVFKVSPDVKSLKEGNKVVVNPQGSCSTCKFCTRGKPNYCETGGLRSTIGFHQDGGWAEYCEVPERQVYKVPEGMSAKMAVLCEPFSCVLNGYKRMGKWLSPNQQMHFLGKLDQSVTEKLRINF